MRRGGVKVGCAHLLYARQNKSTWYRLNRMWYLHVIRGRILLADSAASFKKLAKNPRRIKFDVVVFFLFFLFLNICNVM